jgi:hypothetical protein
MLEMLLVGAIVLVAALYSTWALLPAPARQRVARRLAASSASGWCPAWLRRRLESAATRRGPAAGPCDGCSGHASRDEAPR